MEAMKGTMTGEGFYETLSTTLEGHKESWKECACVTTRVTEFKS